ncbi:hypothetical protein EV175_002447 [Coemansia sp. RSA 1933]|nr:hypothetical protein EV175_002447 [Coemansia sp. RSA 1933]
MSASVAKYSNLPDIDVDQPDVYETPDVPVAEQPTNAEAPEQPLSEDISVDSIASGRAAERFRTWAGDTDGTSGLARYQRSLFRTLQLDSLARESGSLEVVQSTPRGGTAETPEQRLRRLVYETQELEQQLTANGATSDKNGTVALMKLASGLSADLAHLSDTSGGTSGLVVSQGLWQRLAETQKNEYEGEGPMDVETTSATTATTQPGSGDVGGLEARIAALERTLGANESSRTTSAGGHGLMDTVGRLRKQLDMLDPQRVDGIQRRVKQALVDMDRLEMATALAAKTDHPADTKASAPPPLDPTTVKRINELYDKMSAIDTLVDLAPATARRLQSLAKLHAQASDVVARIGTIEAEQLNMSAEMANIKDIAGTLRTAMADNTGALTDNLKHLDTRIASLNERLDALASKQVVS